MTQKDTGGPAFPVDDIEEYFGMTLRDYFAGQALAGYLSAGEKWDDGASAASKAAYYMADAMIAARKETT